MEEGGLKPQAYMSAPTETGFRGTLQGHESSTLSRADSRGLTLMNELGVTGQNSAAYSSEDDYSCSTADLISFRSCRMAFFTTPLNSPIGIDFNLAAIP